LVKKGAWLTRHGPSFQTYDGGLDDDSSAGTGCGGGVTVLIESVSAETQRCFCRVAEALQREQSVALITVLETRNAAVALGTHLVYDPAGARDQEPELTREGQAIAQQLLQQARFLLREGKSRPSKVRCEGVEALVEILQPPPHLFVFGAGPDATPVVQLATLLGWNVSVCTNQSRPIVRDRFAGKARLLELPGARAATIAEACSRPLAIVMAHDYKTDRSNLAALLQTRIAYIGVLGPAQRTERMLDELQARGQTITRAELERIHSPAGLSLGAETAAEIALSIVAEAQAKITRSEGSSLGNLKRGSYTSELLAQPLLASGA
jgi:xanthine/CO dehydrogenase XdhC/CoxF family maturation factor